MFIHKHPYKPFIPEQATKLIVGTLPPPRFSVGNLKNGDVNFCYGSIDGQLWKILDEIFNLNLKFETSEFAIQQRKDFLIAKNIGICDIVESCTRKKIDASDLGMENIQLRDLISYLNKLPKIDTLLLTGGNSKNGPEFLFRSQLRSKGLNLVSVSTDRPKIHEFIIEDRTIRTISLISPSSAANRSIGGDPYYKLQKTQNPNYTTFDFRIEQYRKHIS